MNNIANNSTTSPSGVICIKCHEPALKEKAIERLPDGGTLIKAFHSDGKECSWAEYDVIEDMMKKK